METKFLISKNGMETPCILREPDSGAPVRVVLGVHGIGGSMRDGIQESIADEMELFGSAVLRFDFPGHGDNLEDVLTLQNCTDTLLDAADYAVAHYPSAQELCVFATGFGAYVTLTALQDLLELPLRIKLVVQTPSLHMDQTVLDMAQISHVTLEAMEWAVLKAPRPIGITYDFYEELRNNVPAVSCPIPFLILHGEQDDYIPMSDIQLLHGLNEQSKLVIIPGASHRFQEPGVWDMVLDLTRDWFDFEQVLLADAY
jgi:alpha-beta hydrolase superfamily lysophospholipase